MPVISKITGAPFRFWCQKILPAVYDDSLSYYELLCKVVDYLNKVMEDDINVINLVNELEEYVNNYFNNLDVQEEINNKLDSMVEDGTLINIIAPYVDPIIDDYKDEVNDELDEFKSVVNGQIANQTLEIGSFKTEVSEHLDEQDADVTAFKSMVDGVLNEQDNNITVLQTQMSEFIQSYSDIQTFTELYTSDYTNGLHYIDQVITLSEAYTDYEELDIYWNRNSDIKVTRVRTDDLLANGVYISWYVDKSPETGIPAPLYIALMHIVNGNIDHTQLSLQEAYSEEWNGLAASDATRDKATTASEYTAGCVYKIVGVRYTESAELSNIRIANDGEVYSTAGDAVRAQVNNVYSYLSGMSTPSPNLYNPMKAVTGILTSSGNINDAAQYSNYKTSEFLRLTDTNVSVLYTKPFAIAFYGSDKTFIERLTGTNAPKDTVYATNRNGSQAYYMRITWNTSNADYSTAMVIQGNDLTTPYSNYGAILKVPGYVVTDSNLYAKSTTQGVYTPERFDPNFMPQKVRQAAWRGNTRNASGESIAPENSWSSYEYAVENNFDMLWIAVIEYSSTGTFYCSHDNQLTINGVTDEFYNFTDEQIDSYRLSDGSKIPLLTDVLKYCALHGMPVGLRMGRLPSYYDNNIIGNSSVTRKQVWDSMIALINRYDLKLNIYSGAERQCEILNALLPNAHIQNTSSKTYTSSDLITQIDTLKEIGSRRMSINAYITNAYDTIILTESVMQYARENNVKVFAVVSEPVATAAELSAIKELCPDYVITHSKLDFD